MSASRCTGTDGPVAAAQQQETVLLEWTVHLLRDAPRRAPGVFASILVALVIGCVCFRSILFGLLGVFVIVSSTAEYLFPIRYRLTDQRACVAYGLARLELRWEQVRRVLPGAGGLRLSPLPAPSRLDAFRGVLLRFGADGSAGARDGVMAAVAARTSLPVRQGADGAAGDAAAAGPAEGGDA